MPKLGLSDQFLLHFDKIRSLSGNKPERLKWLARENAELEKHISEIWSTVYSIKSALQKSPKLFVKHVADNFPDKFRIYQEKWASSVEDACWGSLLDDFDKVIINKSPSVSNQNRRDISPCDEEFDPEGHDAAEEIERLMEAQRDKLKAEEDWELGDPNFCNFLRVGLGAWDYCKKTLRVDMALIAKRYKETEHIFVPKRIANKHGEETLSLYNLLDEAQRAYIFGLDRAAIAMCRSLTEMILIRHYLPQLEGADVAALKGKKEGEFEFIINEAIKLGRHRPNIAAMNLHEKRKLANKILHPKKLLTKKEFPPNQLAAIRDWLRDIRALIENSPE